MAATTGDLLITGRNGRHTYVIPLALRIQYFLDSLLISRSCTFLSRRRAKSPSKKMMRRKPSIGSCAIDGRSECFRTHGVSLLWAPIGAPFFSVCFSAVPPLTLSGRGARRGEPLSSNKARSRQVHVNLTLRVNEEFLERLDQWRARHLPGRSRNATVVAFVEERISGKALWSPRGKAKRPSGSLAE
jgi:hypothetical protein